MRTGLLAMTLSSLLIVGSAAAQPAQQPKHPMQERHNGMMQGGLKLTDQQKKDIAKIKFDHKQKQIDLRATLAHARLDYEKLAASDNPDQDALSAKLDEITKAQADLHKNLLDGWFAVNKILTPEQQKIWKRVLEHPMRFAERGRMMHMRMDRRTGPRPMVGMGQMMGGSQMSDENSMMDMGPVTYEGLAWGNEDLFTDDDPIFLEELLPGDNNGRFDKLEMIQRSGKPGQIGNDNDDQSSPDSSK